MLSFMKHSRVGWGACGREKTGIPIATSTSTLPLVEACHNVKLKGYIIATKSLINYMYPYPNQAIIILPYLVRVNSLYTNVALFPSKGT